MTDILTWLHANWIQLFGVLTGGGAVWFLAKNRAVIGWTLGIINAVFFVVLMAQYHLYADVTLNLYYFVTSGMGLYIWLRGGSNRSPKKITHLSWTSTLLWSAIAVIGTMLFGSFLSSMTDASYPMVDSFTTVLSFIGQFLLARKIFENWYIWILADVIDIWLYTVKGLYMVSALTGAYMIMCIMGIVIWKRIERKEQYADSEHGKMFAAARLAEESAQ